MEIATFHVGDCIIGSQNNGYSITNEGYIGIVVEEKGFRKASNSETGVWGQLLRVYDEIYGFFDVCTMYNDKPAFTLFMPDFQFGDLY